MGDLVLIDVSDDFPGYKIDDILLATDYSVTRIAFKRDGFLWLQNAKGRQILVAEGKWFDCAMFSADGTRVLYYCQISGRVLVADTASGKVIWSVGTVLTGPGRAHDRAQAVMSPSGDLVAVLVTSWAYTDHKVAFLDIYQFEGNRYRLMNRFADLRQEPFEDKYKLYTPEALAFSTDEFKLYLVYDGCIRELFIEYGTFEVLLEHTIEGVFYGGPFDVMVSPCGRGLLVQTCKHTYVFPRALARSGEPKKLMWRSGPDAPLVNRSWLYKRYQDPTAVCSPADHGIVRVRAFDDVGWSQLAYVYQCRSARLSGTLNAYSSTTPVLAACVLHRGRSEVGIGKFTTTSDPVYRASDRHPVAQLVESLERTKEGHLSPMFWDHGIAWDMKWQERATE